MHSRPLGRTGLLVSEIGFGTWGLGGNSYGTTSDGESRAALLRARQVGVNFFDTSDFYGFGHSEAILGQTFADRRASVLLATKAGLIQPKGDRQDFSVKHLEESLARSLDRLQTDYVDLFQLHSPPLDILTEPALLEWLYDLKTRGLSNAVGISVRSPEDGLAVVRDFAVDAIQVNFNLVDQRALDLGLFDLCLQKQVGVIVRTPLCFGFLTGALQGFEELPENDHRRRWPAEQRQRWSDSVRLFWDGVCAAGQTPAQLALRFCLSQPGVATVIPGMLTPAHVEENVHASDLGVLPAAFLANIHELYRSRNFFLNL